MPPSVTDNPQLYKQQYRVPVLEGINEQHIAAALHLAAAQNAAHECILEVRGKVPVTDLPRKSSSHPSYMETIRDWSLPASWELPDNINRKSERIGRYPFVGCEIALTLQAAYGRNICNAATSTCMSTGLV